MLYTIYMDGVYLGNTTQPNYTYNGIISSDTEFTVKSSYSKYALCESEGVKIVAKPFVLTPTVPENTTNEPTTTIAPSNTNNFTFNVNISSPAKLDDIKNMHNSGTLITVLNNGIDVTKESTINLECDNIACVVNVKYKNQQKQRTINIAQ